jgi:hypothetical protein
MNLRGPWAFLILVPILVGCASYQLGSVSDPGFQTVFIENFKSDVDEPLLENLVTTTVIQQFQNDGTVRVTSAKEADVILRGRIDSFDMTPIRYSRANELTPVEANMTIGVTYNLTRRGETKPFRQSKAIGTSTFFIGNDLQSDKRQGVPLASERLGRQMVSDLVDGW